MGSETASRGYCLATTFICPRDATQDALRRTTPNGYGGNFACWMVTKAVHGKLCTKHKFPPNRTILVGFHSDRVPHQKRTTTIEVFSWNMIGVISAERAFVRCSEAYACAFAGATIDAPSRRRWFSLLGVCVPPRDAWPTCDGSTWMTSGATRMSAGNESGI